jgi:hypothetical protein
MKALIAILFLSILCLTSCQDNRSNNPLQNSTSEKNDSLTEEYDQNVHLVINDPTDIWKTDYIAFEVFHRNNTGDRSIFSYDEVVYKEAKSVGASCWNLIFYNTKTRDYNLLDSVKKMLIYDYELNDTSEGKVTRNIARYEIKFDDNKDGKFTNSDSKRLFVSDRLGKSFHQVSPEGLNVINYQFAPKENFILIFGTKDTNNDGVFDEKDKESIYRLDMSQSAVNTEIAQPVFSNSFEKMLQKRVETDWKLPKN